VVFDDVAGEHHVFIRHVDDDVARGMRAAQMHQIDAAVAQIDRHIVGKGGGGVGQAGDGFVPLKQAGEALEFAVPVLFGMRMLWPLVSSLCGPPVAGGFMRYF